MAFQIDTFQADAFHLNIPYSPFTLPMAKQYNGTRVTTTGVIQKYRATATGEIDTFDIYLRTSVDGTATFNIYLDGVAVWAGGSRPSITSGNTHVQKTGIGQAVTLGQLVEIAVEVCPASGIPSPIDSIARVVVS